MLSVLDIQNALLGVEFMPGWSFEVYQGQWEGPHVRIHATVPNAYHPNETVELDIHSSMPPFHTREDVDEWMVWRLSRIWTHEVLENYRREGYPVYDPHRDGADQDRPVSRVNT